MTKYRKPVKGKNRYVKVEALGEDELGEVEWYAVGTSRSDAKSIADEMGMPTDNRRYVDIYLTEEQYMEIPEWS